MNSSLRNVFFFIGVFLTSCVPIAEPSMQKERRSALYVAQGVQTLRVGKMQDAEASFLVAEEIAPSAMSIDGLGCVAFRRGDYRRAERYFKTALERDESYAAGYGNLALLYDVLGKKKLALGLYQKALSLDPENFKSRNNFGVYLVDEKLADVGRREILKAHTVGRDATTELNRKSIDRDH